jgi:hypothetical protein
MKCVMAKMLHRFKIECLWVVFEAIKLNACKFEDELLHCFEMYNLLLTIPDDIQDFTGFDEKH